MKNPAVYTDLTVRISYDSANMTFDSDAKIQAFHAALGRMVAYQMACPCRGERLVTLSIQGEHDGTKEIVGCYYPSIPARNFDSLYRGTPEQIITDAVGALRVASGGRPFVLGAVPQDDGTRYGFHS